MSSKISIKTDNEIEKMRTAGKLAAQILEMIEPYVKEGVTTNELDQICHEYITKEIKAHPSLLNYRGFPKTICTSVNHQVCHGIPSEKKLKTGDIINIDVTIMKDGYHGDTSKMYIVGETSIRAKKLIQVTQECLYRGINIVKPGATLGDIGATIQEHAEAHRFSIVRDYCGHGIGKEIHEQPQVLHYGKKGTGITLKPGMIFTIEPMINAGKHPVKLLPDNWTVVTKDRSLSAQFEHTVLVTENGYEILTLREEEKDLFHC